MTGHTLFSPFISYISYPMELCLKLRFYSWNMIIITIKANQEIYILHFTNNAYFIKQYFNNLSNQFICIFNITAKGNTNYYYQCQINVQYAAKNIL
jgi:hypothetical protein